MIGDGYDLHLALSSIQPIIVIRPKMAFFGLKSVYTKVHFFLSKTPSLNCLKMHHNEVLRSILMWEKFGPVHPSKYFHDKKNELFARSDLSTG